MDWFASNGKPDQLINHYLNVNDNWSIMNARINCICFEIWWIQIQSLKTEWSDDEELYPNQTIICSYKPTSEYGVSSNDDAVSVKNVSITPVFLTQNGNMQRQFCNKLWSLRTENFPYHYRETVLLGYPQGLFLSGVNKVVIN